jgi:tetratricopeptide (TPR) repeat protein
MSKTALAYSLRSLLLLTTAMTLVACDDTGDDAAQTQAEEYRKELEQKVTGFYDPMRDAYPDRTISGNFLAGLHAQQNGDWKKASDYFSSIKEFDPNATHLDNRIMALSIGSGQYEQSLAIAKKLAGDADSDQSLAGLLVAIDAFKNADYAGDACRPRCRAEKGYRRSHLSAGTRTWADIAAGKKKTLNRWTSAPHPPLPIKMCPDGVPIPITMRRNSPNYAR